jgi:hypothetical protein
MYFCTLVLTTSRGGRIAATLTELKKVRVEKAWHGSFYLCSAAERLLQVEKHKGPSRTNKIF